MTTPQFSVTSVEVAHLKQGHCKEDSYMFNPIKLKIRQLHNVSLRKLSVKCVLKITHEFPSGVLALRK